MIDELIPNCMCLQCQKNRQYKRGNYCPDISDVCEKARLDFVQNEGVGRGSRGFEEAKGLCDDCTDSSLESYKGEYRDVNKG